MLMKSLRCAWAAVLLFTSRNSAGQEGETLEAARRSWSNSALTYHIFRGWPVPRRRSASPATGTDFQLPEAAERRLTQAGAMAHGALCPASAMEMCVQLTLFWLHGLPAHPGAMIANSPTL